MKNKELMSEIVNRLQIEPGLILLHHNADIDAVGSAIALKSAYPGFCIGAFQNISLMSKNLINNFENITILQEPDVGEFKTIVVLDASTPNQIGISRELLDDPIVIDHHTHNELWGTEYYYCDDSKSSCAEIILELLEYINFNFSNHPKTALALLTAILVDSGHFKYANYDTFINFAKLLKLGNFKMQEVLKILDDTYFVDYSQRVAHLKGAQRLRFRRTKGYLIATSQLSSYEASMCKNLLILGADVAFVGAQRDEQIRISARASNGLVQNGLHLGKFFQDLGMELSCEGGGHAGAAGVNGLGDVEMALNICLEKISKILNQM